MVEIPKGFKSVRKVYVVDYDNGEMYEDGMHCVDGIFQSRKAAEKYLRDIGAIKDSKYESWSFPEYVCSMNNMYCENCPKFGEDDDYGCEEYELRIDSEWDNSYYTIHEYDLFDIV